MSNFFWSYQDLAAPPMANSKYGLLYNWPAATSGTFMTGWRLPTFTELFALQTYLGGESVSGGKIKETGTTHWSTPNTGATNEVGFNAIGGGIRNSSDGSFTELTLKSRIWGSDNYDTNNGGGIVCSYNNTIMTVSVFNKKIGASIRLICDSGIDPGYVDIDGKRYMTVSINGVVYMAENLQATHYSDGTPITEITSNATWAAAGSSDKYLCAYGNNWSNV